MRLLRRGFMLVAGAALLPNCKTAGFKELYMSTDREGRRRTKTFPPEFAVENTGIYCHIVYSTGREDAELKVYFVSPTEGTVGLLDGDEIFLTRGEGELTLLLGVLKDPTGDEPGAKASVDPKGPWELGEYQLQFFIDNEKEDSINFIVEEPSSEAPPT
ncbi:MAG: hypothetical protein EOO75_17455 [Myxococcales bacterium]|nr:MAG: hypothetical protein EOO75_17455 [Myxococcales bacterium]